ncbi:metal-binding protein [Desulfocarbo indianensis]|nr:metal-binding protein [Desulfocarbo indianensis]
MAKTQKPAPACAACDYPLPAKLCVSPEGKAGKGCPTVSAEQVLAEANAAYQDPATLEFARQASRQEAACYANRHERPYVMQPEKTRIVEIAEFARRMGYEKLGLAFCVGLAPEAALAAKILEAWGFTVFSACCKSGRTSKEGFLGLSDEEKIFQGRDESMCNPIYQAKLLAAAGAQFNVLLGLCVGHDSLFMQHAQAPTTVLAVKDRVTGHNPLAALYTSGTYYAKVFKPKTQAG